ncbi:hypothetical protein QQF64_026398 [Cirrhinus molitorella]|uniref:PLA2c domain-containing protein n=1 Tax=Cirrhinus molitorella TaxID=172907 RepID=A0ABR3N9G7_9TELE
MRKMSAFRDQKSGEVRIAHSLHKNEEEFVAKRRETVFQSLQKLGIHCSQNDVPNIALLGSGGGQRAMVGLLGSLVELDKAGLLDCILYLSGVSGSTWCMASLYQEPDWSTKLDTVKDKIIKRLSGPGVSCENAYAKLKNYHKKENFSLTDVWAVLVVTEYVKEIDDHSLTDQWDQLSKDPFPIYAAIDKQCKQEEDGDPWFEISPYEAGYSLSGAFVETSSFGSQFHSGSKKKHQPEIDMLYLQALCGSVLADGDENVKFFLQKIKEFFQNLTSIKKTETVERSREEFGGDKRMIFPTEKLNLTDVEAAEVYMKKYTEDVCNDLHLFRLGPNTDPRAPSDEKCYQVLMDLVDMNLSVLNGKDPSALEQTIRTTLNEISGGKRRMIFPIQKLNLADKEAAKVYMKKYTEDVCNDLCLFRLGPNNLFLSICICMAKWIWGRRYNFLHKMTDKAVPAALLESNMRDFEDAGLLNNSPYFSVLREERNIDLIISLDFSEGDPFKTVREAAKMCKKLNIPFPEVNIPNEDSKKPKDFYVFKGQDAPTVIHIPLFNVVNCGDDIEAWKNKYATFQLSYSAEMITDLMEVAGKNISNNREKLKEQIRALIGEKH